MKRSLSVLLVLAIAFTSNATTYYFSTSGNDANNGTSASTPWKTLIKFNSISSSINAGDNVLFNRGNVFYGNIIIKTSGTSISPITIGAYGTGADPVITGFTTAGDWTNVGDNIWESTSAVSVLSTVKLVVINGINTGMGRYPNTGYLTYQTFSGNTSITSSSLNSAVTNWTGAQLFFFANAYSYAKGLITAQSGGTVTYSPDPRVKFYNHSATPGFFIQDDVRTLDTTGEWYYNPTTKKIRVYNAGTPVNVQVATIDTLVYVNNHDYITFANVSFQGANTTAIEANNSKNLIIQNCDFNFTGVNAINGQNGANLTYIDIENCTFNHGNNNAINVDRSDNATIRLSTIKNFGVIPGMVDIGSLAHATSITTRGANTLIEYNVIDSTGYSGISFIGNNTIVQNNYIKNSGLLLGEGGNIYTYNGTPGPPQAGIKVKNNICVNNYPSTLYYPKNTGYVYGLFFDGYSNNMEVSGNAESGSAWGMMFHESWSMNIHDNTIYNNSKNSIVFRGDDTMHMPYMNVKHNIFFAKNANDYTLWYEPPAIDPGGLLPHMTSDSNYWARPIDNNGTSFLTSINNGALTLRDLPGWQSYSGQDLHSKTTPKTVTTVNDLRFEYNETTSDKAITLDATYVDVENVSHNGQIILAPFTSAVLIKTGPATNKLPTANAGSDQTITLPTNIVSLSGSGTDPDGTIAAYNWTKISGPTGIITNAASAATTVTALQQGLYQFQLKVTDNLGAVDMDTVRVTVNGSGANIPPISNAGPDQIITLPTTITTISGDGTDPDGTISSYSWKKVAGPSAIITDATSASTTITGLLEGIYQFTLQVTDNKGATDMDTIQVTVNAGDALLPAVNPSNTVNGLDYKYYESSLGYSVVPNFSELTPAETGSTTNFNILLANRSTAFAFNFTGFINVPSDGQYTFYTNSDDGSNLYIDNVLVVNNDGLHGATEKSGTIGLQAGKHAISVGYFQQGGDSALSVTYEGPGISRQAIPAAALFRVSNGLLPAVNPANTVNGLDYEYYESIAGWIVLPNFSQLLPVKTGSTGNFNLSLANKLITFSFNFTGFVTVPSDGQYTFYTNSDDGSNLYIDNILVVNNDGLHGATEKSGTIGLQAGKHAISVGYFQQGGGSALSVSYSGPGVSKQALPASALYRISTSGLVSFDNNINQTITSSSQVSVKAYPNPFSNYIELNIPAGVAGDYKLVLADASGKIVWMKSGIKNTAALQQSINTSSLQKGIYLLKVIQNNTISVIKLEK